jgi:hypothetical protein
MGTHGRHDKHLVAPLSPPKLHHSHGMCVSEIKGVRVVSGILALRMQCESALEMRV